MDILAVLSDVADLINRHIYHIRAQGQVHHVFLGNGKVISAHRGLKSLKIQPFVFQGQLIGSTCFKPVNSRYDKVIAASAHLNKISLIRAAYIFCSYGMFDLIRGHRLRRYQGDRKIFALIHGAGKGWGFVLQQRSCSAVFGVKGYIFSDHIAA